MHEQSMLMKLIGRNKKSDPWQMLSAWKVHEPKAKNCSYRKSPITQIRPRGRVRYSNRLYTGGKLTIACNHSHLRYNNNNNNADKEKQWIKLVVIITNVYSSIHRSLRFYSLYNSMWMWCRLDRTLTTVSGSCILFLMNSHYSRFYAQLSLRDYNNAKWVLVVLL